MYVVAESYQHKSQLLPAQGSRVSVTVAGTRLILNSLNETEGVNKNSGSNKFMVPLTSYNWCKERQIPEKPEVPLLILHEKNLKCS